MPQRQMTLTSQGNMATRPVSNMDKLIMHQAAPHDRDSPVVAAPPAEQCARRAGSWGPTYARSTVNAPRMRAAFAVRFFAPGAGRRPPPEAKAHRQRPPNRRGAFDRPPSSRQGQSSGQYDKGQSKTQWQRNDSCPFAGVFVEVGFVASFRAGQKCHHTTVEKGARLVAKATRRGGDALCLVGRP